MEDQVCALCGKRARMLCESDQAKLCWDCDRTVHGANFLVAKHVRVLLCRLCHSPTPWKASGPSLIPTSSLCHRCVPITTTTTITNTQSQPNNNHHVIIHDDDDDGGGGGDYHSSDDDEDEEELLSDDDVGEEEDEEGENQVVPWSSPSSSSEVVGCSDNNSDNDGDMSSNTDAGCGAAFHASPFSLKRFPHHNIHHHSDDFVQENEIGCSSSEGLANNDEFNSMRMLRPFKQPRLTQRDASQWHNQRWGRTRTQD